MGLGDAAGDASHATHTPSLLEPFTLEDFADLQSPRAGLSSPTASLLPLVGLLTGSPTWPPSPDPPTHTSPAMPSSHCSNPVTADEHARHPQHPQATMLQANGASNQADELSREQPSCTLPEWYQSDAPLHSSRGGRKRVGGNPAPTPMQASVPLHKRRASEDRISVNPLEGFNPYMTSGSGDHGNGPSFGASGGVTSSTPPSHADAPSPPLRLSLQQHTSRNSQNEAILPGSLRSLSPSQVGRNLKYGDTMRYGDTMKYGDSRSASRTPPGYGSRVVSGCMTSAAMAAHEDLMAFPLISGQRTRSISAPIVRQGPAILRSKTPHKLRGASGLSCHVSSHEGSRYMPTAASGFPTQAGSKYPSYGMGSSTNASPPAFQEQRRCSESSAGRWMPDSTSRLPGQEPNQPYGSMSELDLPSPSFPTREGSLSWGTVEAIAAGYVPGLDGPD